MFYTIISKIPFFANDSSKYKMLKIFIIGSVIYVILHYFLYSEMLDNISISEKLKQYLYYIMSFDIACAYMSLATPIPCENNNENYANDANDENGFSPEQIKAIQQHYKMLAEHNISEENKETKNPFKKMKKSLNEDKKETEENETEEKDENSKKENKKEDETDTRLPKYVNK